MKQFQKRGGRVVTMGTLPGINDSLFRRLKTAGVEVQHKPDAFKLFRGYAQGKSNFDMLGLFGKAAGAAQRGRDADTSRFGSSSGGVEEQRQRNALEGRLGRAVGIMEFKARVKAAGV